MNQNHSLASILVFFALAPLTVVGQLETTWTNSSGNSLFSKDGNWTSGVPAQDDTAIFFMSGNQETILDTQPTIKELLIGADGSLAQLRVFNSIGNPVVKVGSVTTITDNANFNFVDPGIQLQTSELIIGTTGGHGGLNLAGGNQLFVAGSCILGTGVDSNGFIGIGLIEDSAAEIGLADSGVMQIGVLGTGEVSVDFNSQLYCHNCVLGVLASGEGLVVLDDSSIMSAANGLIVGNLGLGEIEIDGDSTLQASDVELGRLIGSNGIVVVRNDNSRLNITGPMDIGGSGFGRLDVIDGASAICSGPLNLPAANDGFGILNVFGAGSSLDVNDDLEIGNYTGATGWMFIDGAEAAIEGITFVGLGGLLSIRGSQFESGIIANGGELEFLNGISVVDSIVANDAAGLIAIDTSSPISFQQGLENYGEVQIANDGRLNVFGELTGNGFFSGGGELHLNGPVKPGNQLGELPLSADVFMTSSSQLEIQIGGTQLTQIDSLQVDGNLTLENAGLVVTFVNGFEMQAGQSFRIAKVVDNLTGIFLQMPEGSVVAEKGGLNLVISYTAQDGNDIELTVVDNSVPLGDVNLDGNVNLLDIAPFVSLIANSGFQGEADINLDGVVDLLDVSPFIVLLVGN